MTKKINLSLSEASTNNSLSRLFTTTILSAALMPTGASAEDAKKLATVKVIESSESEKYNPQESSFFQHRGSLVNTPQSITKISRKLMDDQNSTTLRDALRNAPGISISAGEGGGGQGDNLTIRGFSGRNDFFVDGMRDFGSYYRDPFNLESVEVVQGPSSILFGRGSAGGVVQQNSKQASLKTHNKTAITIGSNQTRRVTTDVGGKIQGIEGAAFRLNAMYHENNFAGRDQVENERYGIAPTLSFGLGSENRLTLSHLHQSEDNVPDYGLPWLGSRVARVDRENYYGFKDDYLKTDVDISTVKFEHDFGDETTLKNQFRYARYSRGSRATQPKISTAQINNSLSSITVDRNQIAIDSKETYIGNQTDLAHNFEAFGFDHESVSGISFSHETASPTRFRYSGVPSATLLAPSVPASFSGTPSLRYQNEASIDTVSAYFLDTIHINKKWDIIASVRFDHLESHHQGLSQSSASSAPVGQNLSRTDSKFNWHEAIVYKPRDNGSIYFDYGTSFNPSAEGIALTDSSGRSQNALAPEENEIFELGTKWEFFKKKLSTSFSVFTATKKNARELNGSSYVSSGEQQVDGLQAQISGKITDKWSIFATYAFLDSKVTKTSVTGSEVGNRLTNVPDHNLNIFTTYNLPYNLEIGGGINYISSRAASVSSNSASENRTRQVPGYLTVNAMAKYPLSKTVEMQLNVTNLTNEYFQDRIYAEHSVPGEGRAVMLTAILKF